MLRQWVSWAFARGRNKEDRSCLESPSCESKIAFATEAEARGYFAHQLMTSTTTEYFYPTPYQDQCRCICGSFAAKILWAGTLKMCMGRTWAS